MKKKRSSFRNKVRRDAERQKAARSNYGYLMLPNGVSVFSPEPGSRIRLDIMPYEVTDNNHPDKYEDEQIATPGELWYKRPFRIHRNIGVGNDAVVCPRSFGKPCPICEYREKLIKEGADKEETDALRPSQRNLYVVIPQGAKGIEEKPHIWDMSQYLFQNLLNTELEEDEDNAIFPDLEEGLTLRVRFDASQIGGGKAFAEASRIDFTPRKKPYDESILEDIPKLDDILRVLSYKELEAKFLELEPDDLDEDDAKPAPVARASGGVEEDEEEDDAPARPAKKSRPKKTPKPAPADEEEDEDAPWDDEEDETPAPPPKKAPVKKRPAPATETEDEDDEEEDEEEDEPAPPPRKKAIPTKKKRKPEPEPEPEDDEDDDWDDDWDED